MEKEKREVEISGRSKKHLTTLHKLDKEEFIQGNIPKITTLYNEVLKIDIEETPLSTILTSQNDSYINDDNIVYFVSSVDLFIDEILLGNNDFNFFIIENIFTVIFVSLKMDISDLSDILNLYRTRSKEYGAFKQTLLQILLLYLQQKSIDPDSDDMERFADINFFIVSLYLHIKYCTEPEETLQKKTRKILFLKENYGKLFSSMYKEQKENIKKFKQNSFTVTNTENFLQELSPDTAYLLRCIETPSNSGDKTKNKLTDEEKFTFLFFVNEFIKEFITNSQIYEQIPRHKKFALQIFYRIFFMMVLIYKKDSPHNKSCLDTIFSLKQMTKPSESYKSILYTLSQLFNLYLDNTPVEFIGGLNHYTKILFFIYLLRFTLIGEMVEVKDDSDEEPFAGVFPSSREPRTQYSTRRRRLGQPSTTTEAQPLRLEDIDLGFSQKGGNKITKILKKYK